MRGNNAPDLGVQYPFKIGKSLRSSRPGAARDLLALKFIEIPDKAELSRPGTLSRTADKCTVQLPTHNASSSVHFSGTRRTHKTDSNVADYLLVFANGKMWLERTADYFIALRPVDAAKPGRPPPDYPSAPEDDDDPARDPDSWMPHADSGSPITPEEDAMVDIPPVPPQRTAGKSTPPMSSQPSRRKMVSAGKFSNGKTSAANSPATASKSVATKSVAGKGLSNTSRPNGRRRNADDDDDDDDDDDGNDGSSSDDDDSDDSDSESDSDSLDYTDRSSDEE